MAARPRGGRRTGGVAFVLLFIALLFIGFNLLPGTLASYFPQFYEGTPCTALRVSTGRANHQSLIGIGAANPIQLSVTPSTLPVTADGFFTVRITVTNTSTGTVPILIDPLNIAVGGSAEGLGLRFNPPNSLTGVVNSGAVAPSSGVLVLGPRQKCVQVVEFPAGNVLVDPSIQAGRTTVQAYYRNNSPGAVTPPTNTFATPIFNNAGLWVGLVESPAVVIPISGAPS
ncbi:MAG TPA: hypothetical protein VER79_12750 [Candidatus Limnocylindrales bacterium]|nr:hypothetical protein [Candidatus Limnocylindrales bacterium]